MGLVKFDFLSSPSKMSGDRNECWAIVTESEDRRTATNGDVSERVIKSTVVLAR